MRIKSKKKEIDNLPRTGLALQMKKMYFQFEIKNGVQHRTSVKIRNGIN